MAERRLEFFLIFGILPYFCFINTISHPIFFIIHIYLLVEHRIGITIEQLIDFDPHIPLQYDSNYNGAVPWGDLDCYVQYFFPTGKLNSHIHSS